MIFRALKTIILEDSSGTMTVHEGDFFRSPSMDVVTQGYARRLTPQESQAILSEYVSYADKIFNKRQQTPSSIPKKRAGINAGQSSLPFYKD